VIPARQPSSHALYAPSATRCERVLKRDGLHSGVLGLLAHLSGALRRCALRGSNYLVPRALCRARRHLRQHREGHANAVLQRLLGCLPQLRHLSFWCDHPCLEAACALPGLQGSLCTSPPRATASKPTVPAVGHPGTAGLQMAASTRNMRPTVWPGTETRRLPSLRSPPRTRRRTRSPRGPRGQGAARAPAGRRRRTARGPSRAAWSRYPAWRPSTRDRPEGPRTPAAAAQRP